MSPPLKIPHRWSLIGHSRQDKIRVLDSCHLVTPAIPSSSLTPLLSGLVPNRDHNEDLGRFLNLLPKGRGAAQPVFSVFAADPFIKAKRIAQRLSDKGYKRVVNWPTAAQYGADFCQALNSVNLGPQQEYQNMLLMAEQNLSISLAVCSAEAAPEFARLQPEIVFLTPAFDLWANGRLNSRELLRRCATLARVTKGATPIVLMAPRSSVSLAQARKAGASALLLA